MAVRSDAQQHHVQHRPLVILHYELHITPCATHSRRQRTGVVLNLLLNLALTNMLPTPPQDQLSTPNRLIQALQFVM